MSVITEIEEQAMSLSAEERAKLADRLIASLPPDFTDKEEIDEAEIRSRELDKDPDKAMTLEQLDEMIANRPAT